MVRLFHTRQLADAITALAPDCGVAVEYGVPVPYVMYVLAHDEGLRPVYVMYVKAHDVRLASCMSWPM
jgi:hypothetical protein